MPEPIPATGDDLLATMPYASALGITLETATAELAEGTLPWAAEHCTSAGVSVGATTPGEGTATTGGSTSDTGGATVGTTPGDGVSGVVTLEIYGD